MALNERARQEMYSAFAEKVGKEPTLTLMEHLPPVGWADVTTKQDLELMRADLKIELAEMRSYVDEKIDSAVEKIQHSLFALMSVNIGVLGLIIAIVGFKR